MNLKAYSFVMIISTIVAWLLWFIVIQTVDPSVTNWIGFSLFYFSLFLSLLGTTAILGFLIRLVAMRQVLAFKLVKEAFRQSFLFSFLILASLALLAQDLFTWLNVILLVVALSVLEYFLLSYDK